MKAAVRVKAIGRRSFAAAEGSRSCRESRSNVIGRNRRGKFLPSRQFSRQIFEIISFHSKIISDYELSSAGL